MFHYTSVCNVSLHASVMFHYTTVCNVSLHNSVMFYYTTVCNVSLHNSVMSHYTSVYNVSLHASHHTNIHTLIINYGFLLLHILITDSAIMVYISRSQIEVTCHSWGHMSFAGVTCDVWQYCLFLHSRHIIQLAETGIVRLGMVPVNK